jgi:hypothetical protein
MMKPLTLTFIFMLFASTIVTAANINSKIIKISGAEQAVVVKEIDGTLKLLKLGDTIDDDKQIIAFEGDHVVLEGPGEWGPVRYVVDVSAGQMHISSMARRPLEKHLWRGGEVTSLNTNSR